jgi:hypothetical protein
VHYFNWNELKRDGGGQFEGILCLTYASIIGYNNTLAYGSKQLMSKLKIAKIPSLLFQRRYLRTVRGEILSFYSCKEPQSYFLSSKFLFSATTPKQKIEYLFMLSQRAIANENYYIPQEYVDEKYYTNPFIILKENRIYFLPEQIVKEHSSKGKEKKK